MVDLWYLYPMYKESTCWWGQTCLDPESPGTWGPPAGWVQWVQPSPKCPDLLLWPHQHIQLLHLKGPGPLDLLEDAQYVSPTASFCPAAQATAFLSLQSNQMWAHRLKEVPVFGFFYYQDIIKQSPSSPEGNKIAVLQRKPKILFNTLGHSQSSFYQVIFGIFQRWTVAFLWATLIFLDRNQCPRSKHYPRILFSQVSSHCHRPARHQKIF